MPKVDPREASYNGPRLPEPQTLSPQSRDEALNILGLESNATPDEIKKASRQKQLEYLSEKWARNPELPDSEKQKAEEWLKLTNAARDYLIPRPEQNFYEKNPWDAP